MKEFDAPDVQACIDSLCQATHPLQAMSGWSCLSQPNPDLYAMVALKSHHINVLPPGVNRYLNKPHDYFVPYFSRENLFFLDDEIFAEMTAMRNAQIRIDYTLSFDSNMATYVDALVQGRPLEKVPEAEIVLKDILRDNLNFDGLFYMIENVKNVRRHMHLSNEKPIKFWKALDRDFRKNMVSLQLFRGIDCAEFRATEQMKSEFTYREAARTAIEFCYRFYVSDLGRSQMKIFELRQRLLLLHLIGTARIQIASAKSPKNKMKEYFAFVHEVVGAYFDREAVIAHKFFCDRKNVPMLDKKIQKGRKKTDRKKKAGFLKELDNIAWDMSSPRFMEKLILSGGEGKYIVPMFVTIDTDLRQMMNAYPIKGVLFNRKTGAFAPLPEISTETYFKKHGCDRDLEYLYSEPVRSERLSREVPDLKTLNRKIRSEFRKLRKLV